MNKFEPELNKLDESMSILYSRLMLLEKDSLEYKRILELFAKQYKEFNTLLNKQKESIYQYFIMYSNLGEIRETLENAGYFEQKSKTK